MIKIATKVIEPNNIPVLQGKRIRLGDRVSTEWTLHGVETPFIGTVIKITPFCSNRQIDVNEDIKKGIDYVVLVRNDAGESHSWSEEFLTVIE